MLYFDETVHSCNLFQFPDRSTFIFPLDFNSMQHPNSSADRTDIPIAVQHEFCVALVAWDVCPRPIVVAYMQCT